MVSEHWTHAKTTAAAAGRSLELCPVNETTARISPEWQAPTSTNTRGATNERVLKAANIATGTKLQLYLHRIRDNGGVELRKTLKWMQIGFRRGLDSATTG